MIDVIDSNDITTCGFMCTILSSESNRILPYRRVSTPGETSKLDAGGVLETPGQSL